MSARGAFPSGNPAASGTDGFVSAGSPSPQPSPARAGEGAGAQLAVCNGDFEMASPREFAAVAGLIGRVPLAPQYGAIYRVVRLWSEPGPAARLYASLAEEPSGCGYRADWFWFFFGDPEMAKLHAIGRRPAPDDARAKTSLLAVTSDAVISGQRGRR